MKFLCDSNYGERDVSFAPLRAYETDDGRIVVVNTATKCPPEHYPSIEAAAENRGFIRRWLASQSL